jgi:hypothetical protein
MQIIFTSQHRVRSWYLLAFLVTMAAGLASRKYSVALPSILGKYPGDVLWALMVFFGMGMIFNNATTFFLGSTSLAFAFGIEFLKLCSSPWLSHLRHTTLGHLFLGHVFSRQNLVAYSIGVIIGMVIDAAIVHRQAGSVTYIIGR